MFSEASIRRTATVLLTVFLLCAGGFLFCKYLFAPCLPFLLAYAIALCLQPLLKNRSGRSRKWIALLAVLALVALLLLLCMLLCSRVSEELKSLSASLGSLTEQVSSDQALVGRICDTVCGILPFKGVRIKLEQFFADLDGQLTALLSSLASKLTEVILPFLGSLFRFLPNALLALFVTLFSAYYLAVDFDRLHERLFSLLPQAAAAKLQAAKTEGKELLFGFGRAYGLLLLLTFAELFSAFLLLGYRLAFLLALCIALVDLLPVLGTGTVLIPWGICELLFGSTSDGIWLLVLYALITVVRQLVEPRIVGKCIGLPPLPALVSLYIGLKLFGIPGLFLLPIGTTAAWKWAKRKAKSSC